MGPPRPPPPPATAERALIASLQRHIASLEGMINTLRRELAELPGEPAPARRRRGRATAAAPAATTATTTTTTTTTKTLRSTETAATNKTADATSRAALPGSWRDGTPTGVRGTTRRSKLWLHLGAPRLLLTSPMRVDWYRL